MKKLLFSLFLCLALAGCEKYDTVLSGTTWECHYISGIQESYIVLKFNLNGTCTFYERLGNYTYPNKGAKWNYTCSPPDVCITSQSTPTQTLEGSLFGDRLILSPAGSSENVTFEKK